MCASKLFAAAADAADNTLFAASQKVLTSGVAMHPCEPPPPAALVRRPTTSVGDVRDIRRRRRTKNDPLFIEQIYLLNSEFSASK